MTRTIPGAIVAAAALALASCGTPSVIASDEDPCVAQTPAATSTVIFVEADDGDPCVEIRPGVWVSGDWLVLDDRRRVIGVRDDAPLYIRSAAASTAPSRTTTRPPARRKGGDAGQDRTPPRRTHG